MIGCILACSCPGSLSASCILIRLVWAWFTGSEAAKFILFTGGGGVWRIALDPEDLNEDPKVCVVYWWWRSLIDSMSIVISPICPYIMGVFQW